MPTISRQREAAAHLKKGAVAPQKALRAEHLYLGHTLHGSMSTQYYIQFRRFVNVPRLISYRTCIKISIHIAPARRAAGLCHCTSRLRGERRDSAPAPRACAVSGRAPPLHPAPARRAAGLRPAPAGAFAPDPEMLTHLYLACGRDGGLGTHIMIRVLCSKPARHYDSGLVSAVSEQNGKGNMDVTATRLGGDS